MLTSSKNVDYTYRPTIFSTIMEELYIGLDCSTTSAKAIAWTSAGRPVAEGRAGIRCASPAPGFAEQAPCEWWAASARAIAQCLAQVSPSAVQALGITVQRETFALLAKNGTPLRPAILWYDARATAELEALRETISPEAYHRKTGKQLDITSAIPKMQWVRTHEPSVAAEADTFVDVLAYLSLQLTGIPRTPSSGIDTTGLVGLKTGKWLEEHVALAGLTAARMPEIVPPCALLGTVTTPAAEECGLRAGTPVIGAGGDGHCFSVGAAAYKNNAATFTIGTGAVLGVCDTRPRISKAFRTLRSCIDGAFLCESVIQCGSATVSWFDNAFGAAISAEAGAAELDEACADIPAGCQGLIALPHWRGVRTPHNDAKARGVVVGWSDMHGPKHFRRAILEGIALEANLLLEQVTEGTTHGPQSIVLGGGGANSNLWCQIVADVTGLPACRPDTVELSSLGAALAAMATCRGVPLKTVLADASGRAATEFEPIPRNVTVYQALREAYAQLYESTKTISHILADQQSATQETME